MLELNEKIKEHFRNPHNVGEIENPEGMGAINNPVCGDTTKLYLRIKNGVVEDAKFLSFGCAVTIASASVLTEKIKGKEISKLLFGIDEEVIQRLMSLIESELGEIPPVKLHCPPATVEVFLESIAGYLEKEGKNELSSRTRRLIPQISEYYKRGEEKE
ncbi:MAG TPA: iron-sulfur cluster assembly scaffold protein [Thermodesulfobacteriota bacterium]|jgi:nitrogen fixation NifU-like protein|nr:iron-sulfur cluster assembly scaffold protein [Thermodesulfobacteriota bacterium]